MNLYKILMTHAAPKDHETAIKEYIIAKDDKEVFDYLKNKSGYTYWDDLEEDEYDGIPKLDFIYKNKGDFKCENKWQDLYYGSTMYSWGLYKENIQQNEIIALLNLKIAKLTT